jgi:hypothetical protein
MGNSVNPDDVFEKVMTEVFMPLYELAVGIAFLYFMYGAFMFMVNLQDPEKKNIGKQHLLWGTIGLFIILSVGGILAIFNSVFEGMFVF